MPPYQEKFPTRTQVRTADRAALQDFLATWKLHNPLIPEQIAHADRLAVVKTVHFYHGGDALYELDGLPGTWHECCLRSADA